MGELVSGQGGFDNVGIVPLRTTRARTEGGMFSGSLANRFTTMLAEIVLTK